MVIFLYTYTLASTKGKGDNMQKNFKLFVCVITQKFLLYPEAVGIFYWRYVTNILFIDAAEENLVKFNQQLNDRDMVLCYHDYENKM